MEKPIQDLLYFPLLWQFFPLKCIVNLYQQLAENSNVIDPSFKGIGDKGTDICIQHTQQFPVLAQLLPSMLRAGIAAPIMLRQHLPVQ